MKTAATLSAGSMPERDEETALPADFSSFAGRPIAFLMRYLHARPIAHLIILAGVFGAVGCSVATQYGMKYLVDTLNGKGAVWFAFAVLVVLVSGDALLWRVASWIANITFVRVVGDLRRDLFRHLVDHAPSYFSDRLPGTITARVTAAANATFMIETMMVSNVLPPIIATIVSVIFVATISIPMAAGVLVIAVAMIWALFHLAENGRPLHDRFASEAAAVDGEMIDVVGNIRVVRAFGGVAREILRFAQTVGRESRARQASLTYLERLRLGHSIVTIALTIGLLAWVLILWRDGRATAGDVVMISALAFTVLHATRDLAVALVDVIQHKARLSEAISTVLEPHLLHDHPEARALQPQRGAIAFDNVYFGYPGGALVFEDFTLHIRPGERVGLVGESGGGKSTLFTVLQRFHTIQGGRIAIDGQDILEITQRTLHDAISVVPQDISLFNRSVMENIRYARPSATDEEVVGAAVAAECLEFIEALPDGMQTLVGDRGAKLSGGQRQRIAIARALLKNAPILLLDEATSALDGEAEEAIRTALERVMSDRTVIAIAHRLSSLRNFDRIVVLQGGRVVEEGDPEHLLGGDGVYRRMVDRELSRLAPEPIGRYRDKKLATG